jgi:hypothetical protein
LELKLLQAEPLLTVFNGPATPQEPILKYVSVLGIPRLKVKPAGAQDSNKGLDYKQKNGMIHKQRVRMIPGTLLKCNLKVSQRKTQPSEHNSTPKR